MDTIDLRNLTRDCRSEPTRHKVGHAQTLTSDVDKDVADWVGQNMAYMLGQVAKENEGKDICFSPRVPGYQWISSSEGDFSIGTKLIEIKCGK